MSEIGGYVGIFVLLFGAFACAAWAAGMFEVKKAKK